MRGVRNNSMVKKKTEEVDAIAAIPAENVPVAASTASVAEAPKDPLKAAKAKKLRKTLRSKVVKKPAKKKTLKKPAKKKPHSAVKEKQKTLLESAPEAKPKAEEKLVIKEAAREAKAPEKKEEVKKTQRRASFEEKIFAYALENAVEHDGKSMPNAVLGKLFQEGLKKDKIKEVMPKIQEATSKVNSMSLNDQKAEFEKQKDIVKEFKHETRQELPELPNAIPGKVVVRSAPFPSGAPHIGNAVPIIINDEYAKKYNGKHILVIDDTIGSEEKQIMPEAYKMIEDSMKWLGVKYEPTVVYKSDRLNIYYKYAEMIINKGAAYVCFCDPAKLRENREKGIVCSCRSKDYETNIKDWKWMFTPDAKQGMATLRLKTDMKDPNPAFRDRVLFRISDRVHPRIKGFKVWPMLEFSWAVDDHLLGITHVIRGNQLRMETQMEEFIWKILGWPSITTVHTPRISFEGVSFSKSKYQDEIKRGLYLDWSDPRTWSLQSFEKRGIQPQAIRSLIIQFGMSEKEHLSVPIDMLYSENRKLIEDSSRYFFVSKPRKINVIWAPKKKVFLPLHPQHPEKGKREIKAGSGFYIPEEDYKKIVEGKIYRLMSLFNFEKKKGKFVFVSEEHDDKLNAPMFHWLPASKETQKGKVLMPDGTWIEGYVEAGASKLPEGSIIQFERFGFCKKQKGNEFWFTHKYNQNYGQ